jgi:DNA primase
MQPYSLAEGIATLLQRLPMVAMVAWLQAYTGHIMNLFDLVTQETTFRKVAGTKGGEYAGPCPWCGGRDRFRVWPQADRPGYWCRHCDRKGDAIQYLRDHDGLSYREACERLGQPVSVPQGTPRPVTPPPMSTPPAGVWQARARALVEICQQALWGPLGAQALTYLRARGLRDQMLKAASVGYHGGLELQPPASWGFPTGHEPIWVPRGIVLPWFQGGAVWRVVIRRSGQSIPKAQTYITISGSSNTLYRLDTLRPNGPAMIVEGVIDALSIVQEAGDLIAVVAAGSTTGGRLERCIGRLGLSSTVLVAFDADAAGEAAAAWWLTGLGDQAKRWRPYWDDPNAMLQDGADLRTWVREGMGTEPKWWREVARWPAVQRDQWAERAAIMEVDGGLIRREAEACAFDLAARTPAFPGQGIPEERVHAP